MYLHMTELDANCITLFDKSESILLNIQLKPLFKNCSDVGFVNLKSEKYIIKADMLKGLFWLEDQDEVEKEMEKVELEKQ